MPAIIDQSICSCAPHCFAAAACPNDAIAYRVELGKVTIESDLCGDCPGPCTNFCDPGAIKYTSSYDDFDLLVAQVEGTLSPEEIAVERARRKEEAQRQAEAEKAAATAVVTLTTANFDQFVRSAQLPLVIDFWADWCGPCKQMAPIFEQLAKQYADHMIFAKVDTDREQVLAQRLGIRSLPTLLFIYRGQVVDGVVGAVPPNQLQARIYQVLTAIRQLEGQGGGEPATPAPPGSQPARPAGQPGGRSGMTNGTPPNERPKIILP